MIRAFIAIELDRAVLQRIGEATASLQDQIPGIRWTPDENRHLTLKFLGDIDESRVESIGKALERELSLFPRFTIHAKGLGVFPEVRKPRILWVGVEGIPLVQLAERVDIALATLGFEREQRRFTPHLTIGRWRHLTRSDAGLRALLEEWRERDFNRCAVDEVVLFRSILGNKSAEYRRLSAVRLGGNVTTA
jgi:2'-5' RNA ligase